MLKVFLDWSTGNGAFIRKYSISLYLRFTLSLAPFNLQQDSSISLQPLLARLYPLVLPFLSPILAARASFCIDVFHSPLLSSLLAHPHSLSLSLSLSLTLFLHSTSRCFTLLLLERVVCLFHSASLTWSVCLAFYLVRPERNVLQIEETLASIDAIRDSRL